MLGYVSLWGANRPQPPATNRGLNSQPALEISCDWVQFALDAVPDTAHAIGILSRVEDFWSERLEVRFDRKMKMGCWWDGGSLSSQRGCRCYWDNPKMGKPGKLLFVIPSKALKTQSQADNRIFLKCLFEDYKGRFTRFDIALDDYEKQLDFDEIEQAIEDEWYWGANYAEIRKSRKRGKLETGKTAYFGSSQSDKMVRVYDKNVESKGEIDAIRMEVQFRGEYAEIVGGGWLNMAADSSQAVADWMASIVVGSLDFRYRESKNRDRCSRVPWWAAFCERVAVAAKRVSKARRVPCLVRSMDALNRQWASMLAVIMQALGDDIFMGWLFGLLDEGSGRLGVRHRALLSLARDESIIECALQ